MDSTPVRRCANRVQDFHNPHFKPLWEPDTIIGRNAIKYSLIHHLYQQRISNAGLCGFCTDELTRRVSEVARRLKAKDLFHDEKAFMDLFWQDSETDGGAGVVAGETIVVLDKDGKKVSAVDHAEELALEMSTAWWDERGLRFQSEIAAMDRSEAIGSRGSSWVGRLGRRDGVGGEATPWETRFVYALWTFSERSMAKKAGMATFVDWQERYLNFSHEDCQCLDTLRLRNDISFETVLMERVFSRIDARVWEVIPLPSEDVWLNKNRFLTYFADQSSGIRNDESVYDYAYSRGEVNFGDKIVPSPLPQGWQRRCEVANTVWYYDCKGRLISRGSRPPHVPSTAESFTADGEDLIEL